MVSMTCAQAGGFGPGQSNLVFQEAISLLT